MWLHVVSDDTKHQPSAVAAVDTVSHDTAARVEERAPFGPPNRSRREACLSPPWRGNAGTDVESTCSTTTPRQREPARILMAHARIALAIANRIRRSQRGRQGASPLQRVRRKSVGPSAVVGYVSGSRKVFLHQEVSSTLHPVRGSRRKGGHSAPGVAPPRWCGSLRKSLRNVEPRSP
jgi:hypothetical protein